MNKKSLLFAEQTVQVAGAVEHTHDFQSSVSRPVEDQVFLEVADAPTSQAKGTEVAAPAQEGMPPQQFEFLLNRHAKGFGSIAILKFDPGCDVGQIATGF